MAKIRNKIVIKHKNPIKVRKQKLIDRINSCKSLKEIKEWEKVFSYHPVLKNDDDFDYGYLIDLIEFKLKRMSEYFHTHNIVQNEKYYGDLCDKAIAIINAGYKTFIITKDELNDIYVNTKNVHRFFSPNQLNFILKYKLDKYYLPTIREAKAKALFWKFMHHYIEILWD